MKNGIATFLSTAASQIFQSATSFLVTLGFAQLLTPTEFGWMASIWLVWMLILSFNRSVFTEQILVHGLNDDRSTGYGAFFALWIGLLTGLTVLCLFSLQMSQLLPGALYISAFVGSDAIRYWFFARDQDHRSMPIMIICVEAARFLIASLFLVMAALNSSQQSLMWLSVATGIIWPMVGSWVRRGLPALRAASYLRSKSRFEFLLALQYFLATGAAQLLPFMALPLFGASAFGGMRLAQSSLSPLALLGTAFQPGMIRLFGQKNSRAQIVRRMLLCMGMCTFAALLVGSLAFWAVMATGQYWLPAEQLPTVQSVSLPIIVALTFVLVGQPGGAVIRVLRLGGLSLAGQVAGIATAAIAFYVVISSSGGLNDFVWAVSAGTMGTVVSTYLLLAVRLRRLSPGGHANG